MARMYERTIGQDGTVTHTACGVAVGTVTQDPVLRAWWHGLPGMGASTRREVVVKLLHHHLLVTGCPEHPDVTVG